MRRGMAQETRRLVWECLLGFGNLLIGIIGLIMFRDWWLALVACNLLAAGSILGGLPGKFIEWRFYRRLRAALRRVEAEARTRKGFLTVIWSGDDSNGSNDGDGPREV